jgi:glycosyltransferase involved in cell wall biosynthesis
MPFRQNTIKSQIRPRINIVISTSHREWVLGVLSKELKKNFAVFDAKIVQFPQSRREIRSPRGVVYFPHSEANVFLHHDLAFIALDRGWLRADTLNILIFTHLTNDTSRISTLRKYFKIVLVNNSETKQLLCDEGFDKDLIHVMHNPIDPIFRKDLTGINKERDVVFVSNYTPRKRPDLIIEVIRQHQNLTFTLIGRGWGGSPELKKISHLTNFEYHEFNFPSYFEVLSRHKVFCSLSDLEGGPVPLLESLVAGLNVVVTDTGSSRDLVPKTQNSRIIPINPDLEMLGRFLIVATLTDNNGFEVKDEYFYAGFARRVERLICFSMGIQIENCFDTDLRSY